MCTNLLAAESSRLDLGLPTDWSRVERWCQPAPARATPMRAQQQSAPPVACQSAEKVPTDWSSFPFKGIPCKPETRVNIDALEKLVLENGGKLLQKEVERAERTIDYLRNGAPSLQLKQLKPCLVQNKLTSVEARAAVLKTMGDWIKKGFVADPFKEPPLDDFRVNGMIAIIKGEC